MKNFCVIGINRKAKTVHMDVAREATDRDAMLAIAKLRPNSDIVIAMTPEQLRETADKAEKLDEAAVRVWHSTIQRQEAQLAG